MNKKKIIAAILCIVLLLSSAGCGAGEQSPSDTSTKMSGDKMTLRIENGALQPILEYSSPRYEPYSNEGSDILRFCVYVETDHDTDNDGLADLVKAFIQVRAAL